VKQQGLINPGGLRERLRAILYAPATGAAEIMIAIYMLAFAVPLFRMERLIAAPTYAQMARMAPGYIWALALCCVALFRISAVLRGSYQLRIGMSAASIFVWSLLFLSFILAQAWHPGVTVFGSWILMEGWTLFRIQRS